MALVMLFALSMSAQNFTGLANKQTKSFKEGKINKLNTPTRNVKAVILSEDFSGGALPAGWQNVDNGTTGDLWYFDNPGNRTFNSTTAANGFASFDSDFNGPGAEDADLITSVIDCSALTTVNLSFEHFFNSYNNDEGTLSVSGDNGATWNVVQTWTLDGVNATAEEFDITAFAAGQSQVLIKWNYVGSYSWYWLIDDVLVFVPENDDLGVTSAAPGFVLFGETVTPSLMVKNFGTNTQNDFDIDIVINDGTTDVYTYNGLITGAAIASGATVEYTAATTWTPAAEGSYTITATVTLAGDFEPANDEFVGDINVVTPSYTNNNSYGYDAFDDSGSGLEGFIVSNPLETGLLNGIAAGTSGDFLTCGDMIGGMAYGAEYGTNDVYLVNGDGASFLMGTITGLTFITGLAQDPISGIVYASDYDGAASSLYSVDETFAATFIGQINAAGLITGIAADADGNLYGIDMTDDNFYSIDKTTGAGTIVGSLGIDISYAQDLGSDKINNIIYGTLYDVTAGGGLYTVDMTTGAATLINTFADEVTMCAVYTTSGVGVKSVQNNGIYVYPNPSTGVFVVAAEGTNTVDVVDITGKVIMSKTFNTNTTIEINNAGMYFLRITNEKGTSVEKVIVE